MSEPIKVQLRVLLFKKTLRKKEGEGGGGGKSQVSFESRFVFVEQPPFQREANSSLNFSRSGRFSTCSPSTWLG